MSLAHSMNESPWTKALYTPVRHSRMNQATVGGRGKRKEERQERRGQDTGG